MFAGVGEGEGAQCVCVCACVFKEWEEEDKKVYKVRTVCVWGCVRVRVCLRNGGGGQESLGQ